MRVIGAVRLSEKHLKKLSLSNMARMMLIPLLVLLYLLILTATEEMSSQHHGLQLQRLARTRCSQGPYKRKISCTGMLLKEVPQDLYPGVEELDLSENRIMSILNSSFARYQRIKNLHMNHNKIMEIATGSFYTMPMLQYLDLADNLWLKSITSEMFKFSINLSHLILWLTSVETVPNDILKWLPNLHLLDLSFTRILHINLTSCSSETDKLNIKFIGNKIEAFVPNTFRIDCEINSLSFRPISSTSISSIDPQTIAAIRTRVLSFPYGRLGPDLWDPFFRGIGMSDIEELLLHATEIGEIDQCYFAPLRNKTLQVLDVSYNDLPDLNQMGFLDLPLVFTLIIDRCGIKNIDPANFARMKSLRVLHLNHNKIKHINNTNSWNVDIRELYLAFNSLQYIGEKTFEGLTNLTKLVLRGNRHLSILKITTFIDLRNPMYLDVSACSLGDVSIPNLETFVYSDCKKPNFLDSIKQLFSHSKLLKHVIMRNASLNSLRISYVMNNTSLFRGLRTVISLDVKKNPLKRLDSGILTDLLLLQELDLSDCQLTEIEVNAFEGLQSLQILHLEGNQLVDLPHGVLWNMAHLRNVSLEGNKLKYLDRDLFCNSSRLQNLTLARNQLTGLNHSTFKPILNTLLSIDISENEIACTCNVKWLPLWLSGSITILNEIDTRCSSASLEELQEKPLLSFKPAELCGPNIALYCSLPIVTACIIMVLIFAYRHRWFLKYKLFLLKLAVIGYREIRDARDFDDYQFHLNVMCAEEDEGWVRDRLRPVLEELLPECNRNVYGDNDLPLGMHYYDAVHYVVEFSYKTIVLVSRASIQDNWFVIQFRTAADHVNDKQIENMVVIFLEDIPDDELSFLVRLYLSDRKPYLSWEEDDRFQEYFWPKLIKLLKINLRCNNVIPPE